MTESDQPPNPFSREGGGESWPRYPAAPNPSSYDPPRYDPPNRSDQPSPVDQAYPGGQPHPYAIQPYPSDLTASPYGPSSYGAYAAGPYGYTAITHPQAVPALVLGVIGMVVCPWVGIAALVVGGRARKAIVAEPLRYGGLGVATAGWILGIVGTVWAVLVTLFLVLGFAGAYGG